MPRRKHHTIAKKNLVERLYKRFDKQIERQLLWDCLTYTMAWITGQLAEKQQASVANFATFTIKKTFRAGGQFFWPKIYAQPILRKIIKFHLKMQKENQE